MDGMPPAADTLIRDARIVTVDRERHVFTNGFLAFSEGRIVALGPMAACDIAARETIDARGRLVLPGMANAHNHLVQIAFRGYNDDRWPVLDIPAAVRALLVQLFTVADRLDEERTFRLVRLHALEMLKAGYTATHDEHFTNVRSDSVDGSWAAIAQSGLRGFLTRCIVDAAVPAGHESVDDGLAEVARLHARFASDRVKVAAGFLNFNFRRDPQDMRRIREGALALGVPFGVDMTDNSRGAALRARGFDGGQVAYYRQHGLLDHGPIYAGKAVNVAPQDVPLLAEHDCRIGLVPMLRFFDGQGIAVHRFLAANMLPALGTDAPLVTDCQSPFEVMRQAILAQNLAVKAEGGDKPTREWWLNAERTIEMATLGGARTLFTDDVAGSLEIGRAADCVIVDTQRANLQPDHGGRRTLGALVWGGQAADVDTVFIAGEKLIEGGRSTRWDEETVVREAAEALDAVLRESDLPSMLPSRVAGQSYRGWRYV